jgi:primosomal protein N' (replication factor Y)
LLEQLTKTFPHARVARVDPADPSSVPENVEVYVTTWIGTKPELRPDVSLVGVLNADWLIRRPDLRSAETAHQALVEMAEWAGPAEDGGRLVIQTSDPGHHAIQAVVRGDYDFFLERELGIRKELMYPPYTELVKLGATGPGSAEVLVSIASNLRSGSVRVLGPVGAAPPGRGSQALLKCDDAHAVAVQLRDILPTIPRGVRISVDVDPR